MEYTAYYEQSETMNSDSYQALKEVILAEDTRRSLGSYTLRKLRYLYPEGTEGRSEGEVLYSINLKEGIEGLAIEKKRFQNGVWYKSFAEITREEYQKLLAGDLSWMEHHKKPLVHDFYLQMKINGLHADHIKEYRREYIQCSKKDYVVFNKSISRAAGKILDLFAEDLILINCLDEEKVWVNYKRKYTLPDLIAGMIQQPETALAV